MKEAKIWTPPKLVNWISDDFSKRGFPPPHRLEAEQLVSHALNISRLDIYLQYDKPCTKEEQAVLRELVKRRQKREPVAYIVGSCDFWSVSLSVGPGVLIPRQDTETLVEVALKKIPADDNPFLILEFGTGSAAIPLALCSERQNIYFVTIEKSKTALEFAARNIEAHQDSNNRKNNKINLIHGDGFTPITNQPLFDAIVANPPYIPGYKIASLQAEVCNWEPTDALDGGREGIDYYHYLKAASEVLLKPQGHLIFEHGFDQKTVIQDLMKQSSSLDFVESSQDISQNDRILVYQKNN